MQPKTYPPVVASSFALGFIVLCLVVYILYVAKAILMPFFVAVFVWYLINALARFFGKLQQGGKTLPRFLCFLLAILSLLGGVWLVFEVVGRNITAVMQAAPAYQQNFEKIVPKIVDMFHLEHKPTVRDLLTYIDLATVMTASAKLFTGLAGKTMVVTFYVGFLLYEQKFFRHKIRLMIEDDETEAHVLQIFKNIDIKIQKYIGVKSFVSAIDSMITFAILTFFDVDFAGFWGLLAFFLHFIPYAGSFLAISLPSIIALIQFGDISSCLFVLGSLGTSHAFLGHVLDPYLMGQNLNLSPIFIISSLAMWGMIWGVPGMFLSIPILAMLTIVLSQFPRTRPIAILMSKTGVIEPRERKSRKR